MATQELSTELPSHSQVTRVDNVGEWRSTARPRVLANSAVEFIETQPEKAFGSEVATKLQAQALQYAPEYDKFVSESGFPQLVVALLMQVTKAILIKVVRITSKSHKRGPRSSRKPY